MLNLHPKVKHLKSEILLFAELIDPKFAEQLRFSDKQVVISPRKMKSALGNAKFHRTKWMEIKLSQETDEIKIHELIHVWQMFVYESKFPMMCKSHDIQVQFILKRKKLPSSYLSKKIELEAYMRTYVILRDYLGYTKDELKETLTYKNYSGLGDHVFNHLVYTYGNPS